MAELQTKVEPVPVPALAPVEPEPPLAEAPPLEQKAVVVPPPVPAAAEETKALVVVEKEKENESEFFVQFSKFKLLFCLNHGLPSKFKFNNNMLASSSVALSLVLCCFLECPYLSGVNCEVFIKFCRSLFSAANFVVLFLEYQF